MRRFSCLALPLLLAAGCADRSATALVVALSADSTVQASIDTVHITAHRGDVQRFEGHYKLTDRQLPGTLTFYPDVDKLPGPPLSVRVWGTKGEGEAVITRVARIAFVKEHSKLLRIQLTGSCLGDPCKAQGTSLTCDRGQCIPEEVDPTTLPEFSTNDDALAPVAGSGGSAGSAGAGGDSGQGGGGAGGGDPCGGPLTATVALTADGAPSDGSDVQLDASLVLKASVSGGSGNYAILWTTNEPKNTLTELGTGPSVTISASYCAAPQTVTAQITDLGCPQLAAAVPTTLTAQGRGVHVGAPCDPSNPCGSRLYPWCQIRDALQYFADKPKPVTLRLAAGEQGFVEDIVMVDGIHLEGGWAPGFDGPAPDVTSKPTKISPSSLGGTAVRWAASGAPLAADLRYVTVTGLSIGNRNAFTIDGPVTATLRGVTVGGWTFEGLQASALQVSGAGGQITLDSCSLHGPDVVSALNPTRSSAVEAEGEITSLVVAGGALTGGVVGFDKSASYGLFLDGKGVTALTVKPDSVLRGGDAGGGTAVGLWAQGAAKLTTDGADILGCDKGKKALSALGLVAQDAGEVLVQGSTLRGGAATNDAAALVLSGSMPTSFEVRGGLLEGGSGKADADGLRVASVSAPDPAAAAELRLTEGVTVRGATGDADRGIALHLEWTNQNPKAPPFELRALAQGATLVGASQGVVREGKAVYAVAPEPEGQDTAVHLVDCDIEGGTGTESRTGVWAIDASAQIEGGTISGSRTAGSVRAVGVLTDSNLKPRPLSIKPGLKPATIEGGLPQGDSVTTHGIEIANASDVLVDGATIRGCGAAGCPADGFASGVRIARVTTANLTGNDIAGGGFAAGGQSVGAEVLGSADGLTILGQVIFSKNKRIVGNPDADKTATSSTGLRVETAPMIVADNELIDGGYGKNTLGLNAALVGASPPAQSLDVHGNRRIVGGHGVDATGALFAGFAGAHIRGNAVDGGGSGCGVGCESRGLLLNWLDEGLVESNWFFGGRSGRSEACFISLSKPLSPSMFFAHNLCFAPATNGDPSAVAVALLVERGNATGQGELLAFQNILAVGPFESGTATQSPTRTLLLLRPISSDTQAIKALPIQNTLVPFFKPSKTDFYLSYAFGVDQEKVEAQMASEVPAQPGGNQVLAVPLLEVVDADPLSGDYHLDQAKCKAMPALKRAYAPEVAQAIKGLDLSMDFDGQLRGSPPTVGPDECEP